MSSKFVRQRGRWFVVTLATLSLCACDGADASADAGVGVGDAGGTDAGFEPVVVWEACPLYTDGAGDDAFCANVDLPLDWAHPTGPTISYFVKRIGDLDASRHIWLLQGGPGAAGDGLEKFAAAVHDVLPDVALMIPDHRGTGRSNRLSCVSGEAETSEDGRTIAEAEWTDCLLDIETEWGDGLGNFRTSYAARDVDAIIGATSPNEVLIFGVSYGTFLTQRFLAMFPGRADAVALLGIVNPGMTFNGYDRGFERISREYLDRCAADSVCSEKLGADPAATIAALYTALDGGHCPAAQLLDFDSLGLRRLFGLFFLGGFHERTIALAVVHRLTECRASDVTALANLRTLLDNGGADELLGRLYSRILRNNIIISEMWDPDDPSLADAESFLAASLFAGGSTVSTLRRDDTWPIYARDAYAGVFADVDAPMLMIQGDLDPATLYEQADLLEARYHGDRQTFITIPNMSHGLASPLPDGSSCVQRMLVDFFADPNAPIESCASQVIPIQFDGLESIANVAFGTTDLWGDE